MNITENVTDPVYYLFYVITTAAVEVHNFLYDLKAFFFRKKQKLKAPMINKRKVSFMNCK